MSKQLTPKRLWTLSWLPLGLMLSACMTTSLLSTDVQCSLPEKLKKRTESAQLCTPELQKCWVEFGIAQTGQLGKANARAAAVAKIHDACEAAEKAAYEAALKKLHQPWWKKLLGLGD